ncbi:hypothetical protein BDW59DRAFT_173021 [Aspergillus cavernicola]|uniref:DUF7924 domain-containing protein n=1 Tax=Aspergillus cavernicola TaxID=176166 RepID=A0ABR4I973_9EURO
MKRNVEDTFSAHDFDKKVKSSSPRKPSESNYRTRTLFRAGIYVDVNMPQEVQDQINVALQTPPINAATLEFLASKLQRKSMELTAAQAGETEWAGLVYQVLEGLTSTNLLALTLIDWRPDIKPEVYQPFSQPSVPRKRLHDRPWVALSISSGPIFMAPFSLKTPCPDISVGISNQALAIALESRQVPNATFLLNDLQETHELISDPGVTALNLCFPFFLVEAKSGATGGNLYQAQIQAAVGGASALNILKALYKACEGRPLNTLSTTSHIWDEIKGRYYMANLDIWRTTHKGRAIDFVSKIKISSILNWGSTSFQVQLLKS